MNGVDHTNLDNGVDAKKVSKVRNIYAIDVVVILVFKNVKVITKDFFIMRKTID